MRINVRDRESNRSHIIQKEELCNYFIILIILLLQLFRIIHYYYEDDNSSGDNKKKCFEEWREIEVNLFIVSLNKGNNHKSDE